MKTFNTKIWVLFLGTFFLTFHLKAEQQETHNTLFTNEGPWFTGPFLAPSAITTKPGFWSLDFYVNENIYVGKYDSNWKSYSTPNFYETTIQFEVEIGLLNGLDFQVNPQVYFNETEGQFYSNIGDLPIAFDIQLLSSQMKDPWPNMKLSLEANIPIGKYQHLHTDKKGTDAIGAGSWLPASSFVMSKLWNTSNIHYLEVNIAINYQIGTAVLVEGVNSYGGSNNTRGFVYPGNILSIDASFEYNLTQKWALACDLYYAHGNKTRFSGNPGTFSDGSPVKMTSYAGENWSLAPAVEYAWSANIGLIAGVWFSFAGKNSDQFTNASISLSIYI